ncbi:hypothetical protein DFH09DRAFT_1353854 [Mycena vulgaris]|nr:hypothetical protein DFH09DRAFT_1353854 [Mycena vulgaris]
MVPVYTANATTRPVISTAAPAALSKLLRNQSSHSSDLARKTIEYQLEAYKNVYLCPTETAGGSGLGAGQNPADGRRIEPAQRWHSVSAHLGVAYDVVSVAASGADASRVAVGQPAQETTKSGAACWGTTKDY